MAGAAWLSPLLCSPVEEIETRADHWREALNSAGITCTIEDNHSVVGGGSLPGQYLPTNVLKIKVPSHDATSRKLPECSTPDIVRHEDDHINIALQHFFVGIKTGKALIFRHLHFLADFGVVF